VSLLSVVDGANADSYRNNVGYRVFAVAGNCYQQLTTISVPCTSAIGPSITDGYVVPPPVRASYLDYNVTFFDPAAEREIVYDLAVAGAQLGGAGYGMHDLGILNGQGIDPVFQGPLPIGSGETGFGSVNDSGFPFNDSDILNGTFTAADMLAYFRWVYAPGANSPLLRAQDPADGPGEIGAVQRQSMPVSAPDIVVRNKRPMVYAGPSFSVANPSQLVKLSGYGADDGLPANSLTFSWQKVSGPGDVTFADASKANTTAMFSANGVYVVRLTATDGELSSTSDATITIGGQ